MAKNFVFFEHAMGFALFKIMEFDEITSFVPQIQKSISDINVFREIAQLVAFQPFSSGREALEHMNNSSEGILLEPVQHFLENNLPKSKKKKPVILGVQEVKLATVIAEALGVNCSLSKEVLEEITRGIRYHFHNLVEGVKDLITACQSQLALGHHYARARVKFNVNRIDNMVIQSISLIDQLDKDINTFAMRVREWYSFHFPELIKVVPENQLYVKCVGAIKNRKNMPEDIKEQLENILMDSDKAQNVMDLARSSMGMEISPLDMENVTVFANRVNSLMTRRKELIEYLKVKMHNVAPNLAALIGDTVGARLIAHAGSLVNLAKFPASTVQILGAEKALFRAIKTRGNTPKYGLIYHSTFIGRAGKTNKGRISRYLANKCSVATRIDCFRDIPTEVFGSKLRQQVEDRLKFYETGDIPAKNVDVMVDALGEADTVAAVIAKERRKAEKKEKKKRLSAALDNSEIALADVNLFEQNEEIVNSEKKKKKQNRESADTDAAAIAKEGMKAEKKEKKRHLSDALDNSEIALVDVNLFEQNGEIVNSEKKKKKRKRESMEAVDEMPQKRKKMEEQMEINEGSSPQKKPLEDEEAIMDPEALKQIKKLKKKEKKRLKALQMAMNGTGEDSILTSDGSLLTADISFNTNDSMNTTMNTSADVPEQENAGVVKKKKKNKNKETNDSALINESMNTTMNTSAEIPEQEHVDIVKKKKKKKNKQSAIEA